MFNVFFLVAQSRYDEIAMDSHAYEPIEGEDEQEQKGYNNIGSKPTRIAIKLINLFNSVTGKEKQTNKTNLSILKEGEKMMLDVSSFYINKNQFLEIETYKFIPKLEQKLDFFLEIQLCLLNQFQNRLTSAMDSFEALNLIRSVPVPGTLPDAVTGVMSSADYGGSLAALKRLCRWWASARTICNAIDEYAVDDVSRR